MAEEVESRSGAWKEKGPRSDVAKPAVFFSPYSNFSFAQRMLSSRV